MTLPNAAQQFLKLLDPAAEQFTFQTFQDRPQGAAITNPKLARVHQGADLLQRYYRNGAGVWVTVNETDGRGRRSENIVRIRCIFQEADAGYGGPFPLEPSITIETSPQRFHRYWLTSWGADAQGRRDFAAVMERMVASYGSCKGAKDISRVLRVPGFLHRKSTPHLVQIVSAPGHRYSREQILRAFPPIPHMSCEPHHYDAMVRASHKTSPTPSLQASSGPSPRRVKVSATASHSGALADWPRWSLMGCSITPKP
jgi:hypothetical protein